MEWAAHILLMIQSTPPEVLLTQMAIPVLSCSSVWFFAGTSRKHLGFILGLCGQPFWIYSTFTSGQYGMFAVSLWFTAQHIRGLRNHYLYPALKLDLAAELAKVAAELETQRTLAVKYESLWRKSTKRFLHKSMAELAVRHQLEIENRGLRAVLWRRVQKAGEAAFNVADSPYRKG